MISGSRNRANGWPDPVLALFIVILVACSWPLGANRDWLWPLPVIGVITCALCLIARGYTPAGSARVVILALTGWVLFILGQLLAETLGLAGTMDRYLTRNEALKATGYSAAFMATVYYARVPTISLLLLGAIVVNGIVQAMLGTLQVGLWQDLVARGSFASANHFAGYLALASGAAMGLGLYARARGKTLHSVFAGICILVFAALILQSDSRMSLIAVVTAAFVVAGLAVGGRRGLMVVVLTLIGLAVATGLTAAGGQQSGLGTSATSRLIVYEHTFRMIRDQPLFGTGAGTYETAFPLYRDFQVPTRVTHAESDYLELLAELGVIGMIPLLIAIIAGLKATIRQASAGAPGVRGLALGCGFGVTALLVHGMADFNLQIPANAMTFLVLLGIPVALDDAAQD